MPPPIHVTDHALIRYLERGIGADMAGLRKRIKRRVQRAVKHGANAVTIDGVRFVLVDGNVVTVTETRGHRERRKKRASRRRIKQ